MKVVLDTSALLFWTLDPERLSAAAAKAIEQSTEVCVSSISIWEIALKHQQGKLKLPLSPQNFAQQLETAARIRILSVDWATWLESVGLEWAHRDPADRCIVALARVQGCALVTSDQQMRRFYPLAIW
ncbi:MAG: type II toxin-antitoxin system VapC family toxin [Candidatus Eremiobacteraeota bacterium]|nr:type II toxin-antitoxin system VapC family toxin [Candidatus Eremiobacteraeota bacterium]MCW5866718.1 type II toxin-antitoxin system VapC family toxin [Candidatus Eremiobacteraeota bacterium]